MKKTVKKIAVILTAAVLTAAIGTVTAGAVTNGFTNKSQTSDEAEFTTNSSFKGTFEGFITTDKKMDALLSITTADGSDIIESGKTAFIETNNYFDYYDKTCKSYEEEVIDALNTTDFTNPVKYTTSVWHTVGYDICDTTGPEFDNDAKAEISHSVMFRDPFDTTYPCTVDYDMSGSNTINCYFSSNIEDHTFESLKGETLRASDSDLYIYQIDKVLYNAPDDEFAAFCLNYKEFNDMITDNIDSLGDNQVIMVRGNNMVIATQYKVNIDMDITAKIS